MTSVLDQLINTYVEKMGKNENEKTKDLVARVFKQQVVDELRESIEVEIHDSMKEKIQKEMEEKRTIDQVQHLKTLMLEGIILAFIVGMVVNQFTDMISALKQGSIHWWAITIGISCAFILFVILYVTIKIFNSIVELMKNRNNNI